MSHTGILNQLSESSESFWWYVEWVVYVFEYCALIFSPFYWLRVVKIVLRYFFSSIPRLYIQCFRGQVKFTKVHLWFLHKMEVVMQFKRLTNISQGVTCLSFQRDCSDNFNSVCGGIRVNVTPVRPHKQPPAKTSIALKGERKRVKGKSEITSEKAAVIAMWESVVVVVRGVFGFNFGSNWRLKVLPVAGSCLWNQ